MAKTSHFVELPHSAGILDDFAVRKNVATKEGTIEKVPVNNSDIANKAYVDSKGVSVDDLFGSAAALMPNAKWINAFNSNLGSGTTDVYTVPAGRTALFFYAQCFNTAALATNVYPSVKLTTGVYHKFQFTNNVSAGAYFQFNSYQMIFHAGEKMAWTTDRAGLNIWANLIEFDNCGWKRAAVYEPIVGDNTIYTCPAGHNARLLMGNLLTYGMYGTVNYSNESGGVCSFYINVVPSGGSVGNGNKACSATSVSSGNISNTTCPSTLSSGDFVSVNTSSNNTPQMIYVFVLEIAN